MGVFGKVHAPEPSVNKGKWGPLGVRMGSAGLQTRFYIDPATGLPHIYGHQVDEGEVMEVLEKPGEDRAGRDGSRIALGQTAAGPVPAGHLRSRFGTG
jgi:hypothetical protein